MTDPNQKRKRNQLIIMGGMMTCLLAIIGYILFGMDDTKKPTAPAATTVDMPAPGDVKQQDLWRTEQAADLQTSADRMQKLEEAAKMREEKDAQLQAKLDELIQQSRNNQGGTTTSPAVAPRVEDTPFPATKGDKTSRPIPGNDKQGLYGNKVLPDPFKQSPQGANTLNAPFGEQPKRAEIGIIRFGDSSQKSSNAGQTGQSTPTVEPEVMGFPTDKNKAKYSEGSLGSVSPTEGYIPPGTFFRAVMLNGVDAPAGGQGQSNPLPVALDILDSANMPNKAKLNLKDCRIVASAWGDLSSERMMARVETMSCIINGRSVNLDIKGQIIGEDGKTGVRGRLVSKQGIMIGNAILAGSIGQIGQIYQQQATTTYTGAAGAVSVIGSDQLKNAAIGGGISGGAKTIADYYIQQASKLFPSIETDGGRVVEILVTKGASYPFRALDRNYSANQQKVSVSDD